MELPEPAELVKACWRAERCCWSSVGAIVFPDFQSGKTLLLRPLPKATAFLKLAGNSFNYETVGEKGFHALSAMVRRCESYVLRYGDLESAHAALDDIMAKIPGS